MKIKIAQFIDTDSIGGAEIVLLDLSAGLKQIGFDPIILHFGNTELCQRAEKLGLETLLVPGKSWYKKTITLPLFSIQFAIFLKKHRFDLLHAHLFGPITSAAPAALLSGIKSIGTLHDKYIVEEKQSRAYLLKVALLCKMKLISVSRDMQRFYSSLSQKISSDVIYNGVDTDFYSPLPEKIKSDSPHIISVGRLVKLKRFDLLLKSFALLPQSLAAKLIILGDGPEMTNLQRIVAELGVTSKVCFAGEQDDVRSFLRQSDIFCLVSETEGLSRSIIEAMSTGLAVVAADVGGNSELVVNKESGIIVVEPTPEKIAAALEDLLAEKSKLNHLLEAARKRAVEHFSKDSMIKSYLSNYRQLLGR